MQPAHIIRILPLCTVLLFAGCGGNSTQQPETGGGNTAAEKSEQKVVGMKLCLYSPASGEPIPFLQVSLTQDAFFPPGGVGTASIYNSLKDNFKGMRTDIEGVGDDAFITTGGIYIMADGYYIQIGAGNTSNAAIRARLVEAGKMAVAKLKTLE